MHMVEYIVLRLGNKQCLDGNKKKPFSMSHFVKG